MKKKLLATLAGVGLSLGAIGAQAHPSQPGFGSCTEPLTSLPGPRFCFEPVQDLTPGLYNVSFDYQAEKFAGNNDKTLQFGFLFDTQGGDATRGVLTDTTVTSGWNTFSFLTQAGGDGGLLFAVRGVPGTSFGLSLQNVRVVAAVPEPATYAMLLAGLGAILFVSRRRRL